MNANRLVAIGVPGILLSFLTPVYLKVNISLSDAWMFALMGSLLVACCLTAYFTSKRKESFLITDDGLHTSKHGLVRWDKVEGMKVVDSLEHEVLTIRFRGKEKISIPSQIINNPDRPTFVAFREEMEKRLLETRGAEDKSIQYAYAYSGKGYRTLGFILLLALMLLIPYAFYLVVMREMTVGKFISLIMCFGSILPLLGSIFREELFGKAK